MIPVPQWNDSKSINIQIPIGTNVWSKEFYVQAN